MSELFSETFATQCQDCDVTRSRTRAGPRAQPRIFRRGVGGLVPHIPYRGSIARRRRPEFVYHGRSIWYTNGGQK